jgi:hypothetical protein
MAAKRSPTRKLDSHTATVLDFQSPEFFSSGFGGADGNEGDVGG